MKSKWGTALKILTRYTEIHRDLPRGRLAWGNEGDTYLHRCVYFMNHKVLECLLESFEEGRRVVNAINEGGDTALTMAIECVKTLLLFNARVEYKLVGGLNPPGPTGDTLKCHHHKTIPRRGGQLSERRKARLGMGINTRRIFKIFAQFANHCVLGPRM